MWSVREDMQRGVLAGVCGALVTMAAFGLELTWGLSRRVGDALVAPGYIFPKWYWGGVGDPLQLLLVIGLNVAFYTAVAYVALSFWSRRFKP
jgi:hypothetical protein